MGFAQPKDYSARALREFVQNTWKRNVTGGGYRPVSSQGVAHFINKGAGAESFMRITYGPDELVDLTDEWVEITLPVGRTSVPMIRLINKVLKDNGVPYFIPTYPNANTLNYEDGSGVALKGVITATYYKINGRFSELNGKPLIEDYRDEAHKERNA